MRNILASTLAIFALSLPVYAADLNNEEMLDIEAALTALEVEHTLALDAGDADRVAKMFGENGAMMLTLGTFRGEKAIKAYMAERAARKRATGVDATRHSLGNIWVDLVDKDNARGRAYVVVYRYNPREPAKIDLSPEAIGEIRSEYIRTRDGWRYASRRVAWMVSAPKITTPDAKANTP